MTRIALASDHAGYAFKQDAALRLGELGYAVTDLGCHSEERVDYIPVTLEAALHVLDGACDVVLYACGNGYAMAMLADRLPGMRAAVCHDVFTARTVREMGDANAISIGTRVVGKELAWDLLRTFLESRFLGEHEARYRRRLARVAEIERAISLPDWRTRLERMLESQQPDAEGVSGAGA